MSRPPHARQAVLAAAEAIVKEIGAANLTFDELVRKSGITRGGIVYHFPTKDALLQALVENDLAQWHACVARHRERLRARDGCSDGEDNTPPLEAYLASCGEPDEETSRLVAGLLSAASSSKALNEPWRRYFAEHHAQVTRRCADPTLATVLSLAIEGLFWQETLGLSPLSVAERRQVVKRLLAMAGPAARGEAAAPAPKRRKARP
jgi:AcrR family transcriptional regulator